MITVRNIMAIAMRMAEERCRDGRILYRFPQAIQTRQSWLHQSQDNPSGAPTCLIDVRSTALDGEQGRRFHALVTLMSRGGYAVWLVPHLRCLQSANKRHKRQAIHIARPYDRLSSPQRFDLCIRDRSGQDERAQRTILLTSNTLRGIRVDELPLPYTMHPDVFEQGSDRDLDQHCSRPRQWKLFFGGHRYQHAYRETSYYPHQSTTNRFAILEEALQHFGDRAWTPGSAAEFEQCTKGQHDGFVFVDNERFRIEPARWLESVSRAHFFIAAPGTTYPMSHNCIEALAVGTIPILEYPDVFRPALQDGVNCLTYRGVRSFRNVLRYLDQIDESELTRLRLAAKRYYDEHLAPQAFCRVLANPEYKKLHMFAHLARPAGLSVDKIAA